MTCTPMHTQYGNVAKEQLNAVYQSCSGHDLPFTGTNVLFILAIGALILLSGYFINRLGRS